jgi:hypothetical protein
MPGPPVATFVPVNTAPLERALTQETAPPLGLLPQTVIRLLYAQSAPPRLAAHLRLVQAVAQELTGELIEAYPALVFDCDEVLFGAATHDIGKTVVPSELSVPGSAHEQAGFKLLVEHGVDPRLARFARNHGTWNAEATIEDLLVTLADKIWKAKRVQHLEDLVTQRLCAASGQDPWQAFMKLDDILVRIAGGADDRLAFQNQFPATTLGSLCR